MIKFNLFRTHHLLKVVSLIIVLTVNATAQKDSSGTIEGVVLDGSSDKTLSNAFVKIANTSVADVTDKNGIFTLHNVPFGERIIEISFIGFKTERLVVNVSQENTKGLIIHLFNLPIETSDVIITGNHTNSKFDDMNEMINVLKGKELQREIGITLASTLKSETGLAIRSMGPAPARPVIRGLGSDRITITEDGVQTTDLSATSPDHAVSIEPFTIDRIEVVRGPKILLDNSSTMGGTVNIIRNEIPEELPTNIFGSAGIYGESVNSGFLGSIVTQVPVSKFVFRLEGTHRKSDDLTTPNRKLPNSNIITDNFSSGLSFVDDWGYTGISFREFKSDYGVPGGFVGAHPNGVDITMLKRQLNAKIFYKIGTKAFNNIELKLSRDYYKHTEYERKNIIGAQFVIYNYRGSLDLINKKLGLFDFGTTGISFEHRDFNIGGYVFTPPTKSIKFSVYSYQSFEANDFSFEAGFRTSYDGLNPEIRIQNSEIEPSKKFFTFSGSISLLYQINGLISSGINLNKTSRVPTIEELYSEGPHLAAYSYEIGNSNLKSENGYGIEIFTYLKSEDVFLMFTFFRNDFSYYITPRNTGNINSQTLLPVYQTEGVKALFMGVESYFELSINEYFSLTNSLSYTYGEFKNSNNPLPSIPPLKNLIQLKYNYENVIAGFNTEITASQNRVDNFEVPTSGYIIFNSFIQYSLQTNSLIHNISLSAENLLNKEYKNHLSRVKIIMPEAARNLKLSYRLYF